MISLVFFICTGVNCITVAHEKPYKTEQECQLAAETTMYVNQLMVQRGEAPPHTAVYKCVQWGEPA